jgi:HSP20 family protein
MALMEWKPRSDLLDVRHEINRIFDDFFGHRPSRVTFRESAWSPNVDIAKTGEDIVVKAELPGMTKEDVNISIIDNTLTLEGEKKQENEVKEENYHRVERSYGKFHRSFTLPKGIQHEKIKANFKNGILNINIPKADAIKPKQIEILE